MRCRPVTRFVVLLRVANGTKINPDSWPTGRRSHEETDVPRAGKALSYVEASCATRWRAVVDSPTTRSRPTVVQVHPRPRAISGASRT